MSYWFILLPFLVLAAGNLLPKRVRGEVSFWSTLGLFLLQIVAALAIFFGLWRGVFLPQFAPLLDFNLIVNNVVSVLLLSAGLAGLSALLVGRGTLPESDDQFNLNSLLLIALVGINGIAMVTDIFSLYVFIEVTALASFVMINLKNKIAAREASLKYLILSVVASVLMLSGVALLLMIAGNTSYYAIKQALAGGTNFLSQLGITLFVCGLFIKGGMVPFHAWLPDAYSAAPYAASVFLAGIVTKASGIFPLMILTAFVFGFSSPLRQVLLLVGTISIIVGALGALWQTRMKRLLAYSSISQMGYMVAALGAGTQLGFVAALFHLFNHAVFKGQLFANAAVVPDRDLSELGGLGKKQPITATTIVIGSLSTAGMPPLAGFWSKLLIIVALWFAGQKVYAVIALLASVLTLAYFLVLQRQLIFRALPEGLKDLKEGNWLQLLPAVLLCAITIGVGLVFPFFAKVLVR